MMKKIYKAMIGLGVMCAGTLILGACSANNSPYKDYAANGFDFSVCYDTNGGTISKENTNVVDTYRSEQVKNGIKLYTPDDPARGGNLELNVTRTGYFLAGWYQVRELRVSADGVPLDEEGNPCTVEQDLLDADGNPVYDEKGNPMKAYYSEYGKPQGYTYAEKWDFENDILRRDDFVYEEGKYAFTLYAAWVPNFSYEIGGDKKSWKCNVCGTEYHGDKPDACITPIGSADENGDIPRCNSISFEDEGYIWYSASSYRYDPTLQKEDSAISLPAWGESGAMDYGKLSTPWDDTLRAVYRTEADRESGTNPVTGQLTNTGTWDEETATATGNVARYFGAWDDGLWYRISTKEQLQNNAGMNRNYDLQADLVFTEEDKWPDIFSTGSFTGIFRGNNHTISGVHVMQESAQDLYGGLFGSIAASATIENVTFRDVEYHLNAASRLTGAMFGLFAGELSPEATIVNVKVSGTLFIPNTIYIPRPTIDENGNIVPALKVYDIGALTGNFVTGGISPNDIEVESDLYEKVPDSATGELREK